MTADPNDPRGYTRISAAPNAWRQPPERQGTRPVLAKRWWLSATSQPTQSSYDNAMFFTHFAERWGGTIDEVAARMRVLAPMRHSALIRAAIIPEALAGHPQRCLLHADGDDPATVVETPRSWVMLDADLAGEPEGLNWRTQPLEAAQAALLPLLPAWMAEADHVIAYTGSQGLKPGMRMRAVFLLDRAVVRSDLDALLAGRGLDLVLNRPRQIHFTAVPIFDGIDDPVGGIERRVMIARRGHEISKVPPVPAAPPMQPRFHSGSDAAVGGTIEEMLARMRRLQSHGGPGLHATATSIIAKFMRSSGGGDPAALIERIVARTAEEAQRDGVATTEATRYCAMLKRDLTRFAAKVGRRQQAELDAAIASMGALGSADDQALAPLTKQADVRQRIGIRFLDI